jgi:cytoskeletal protein RodZ
VAADSKFDCKLPHRSLFELRKAAGVTLDQIEHSTKIGKHFLLAIEEGRFQELPGGILSRSYVRQYAAAIGCSAEPILESLEPSTAPSVHSLRKEPAQQEPARVWFRFLSQG